MKRTSFAITLFLLALAERTVFDFGPNIELVTMALILSSTYLGNKKSVLLTLAILATSDTIIGNSSIFIFTWSGFAIPALIISLSKYTSVKDRIIKGAAAGIGATLFFYIWTNFGVWLLDTWGMYPNDFRGLLLSYYNALPFLRYQMTSTLVFVPLGLVVVETITYYGPKAAVFVADCRFQLQPRAKAHGFRWEKAIKAIYFQLSRLPRLLLRQNSLVLQA